MNIESVNRQAWNKAMDVPLVAFKQFLAGPAFGENTSRDRA